MSTCTLCRFFWFAKHNFEISCTSMRGKRLKITWMPPGFRYCFLVNRAVFITSAVRARLLAQKLKGIRFLPVKYQRETLEEWKLREDLSALYSLVRLPPLVGWNSRPVRFTIVRNGRDGPGDKVRPPAVSIKA